MKIVRILPDSSQPGRVTFQTEPALDKETFGAFQRLLKVAQIPMQCEHAPDGCLVIQNPTPLKDVANKIKALLEEAHAARLSQQQSEAQKKSDYLRDIANAFDVPVEPER